MNRTPGQLHQDLALEPQGLTDLAEAYGDAGVHVPVSMGGHLHREPIV
jgi:hypothetical protein